MIEEGFFFLIKSMRMSVPIYLPQMLGLLGIYCSCLYKYVLVEVALFGTFENADTPEVKGKRLP